MPLLILPLGVSILILLFAQKRKYFFVSRIAIVFLWFFSLSFTSQILWRLVEYPWQRKDESQATNSDAIVVLSNNGIHQSRGAEKIIEWTEPDRFLSGIKLFKLGKAPKLFFTGGYSPFAGNIHQEGDLYIQEAIGLGIPSKALFTTGPVLNTYEESKAIRKIFGRQYSRPKIILVTSAFHMQRAKQQFEKRGFIVQPFPVDFQTSSHLRRTNWKDPYNWIPNSQSLDLSSKALRELLGRTFYRSW